MGRRKYILSYRSPPECVWDICIMVGSAGCCRGIYRYYLKYGRPDSPLVSKIKELTGVSTRMIPLPSCLRWGRPDNMWR